MKYDICYSINNLKNIMLSKSLRHKRTHIVQFCLNEIFSIGKFVETENRLVVAQVCG